MFYRLDDDELELGSREWRDILCSPTRLDRLWDPRSLLSSGHLGISPAIKRQDGEFDLLYSV
jgi:hypothetical protein